MVLLWLPFASYNSLWKFVWKNSNINVIKFCGCCKTQNFITLMRTIVSHFMLEVLTVDECKVFGCVHGYHEHQKIWEATIQEESKYLENIVNNPHL